MLTYQKSYSHQTFQIFSAFPTDLVDFPLILDLAEFPLSKYQS